MSSNKRRGKPKKRRRSTAEEFQAGPARLRRAGKNIYIRTGSDPAWFAAMRHDLAAWRAQGPAELRAASEALLATVAGIDPLTVLGFVFNHHHISPQLAGGEMTASYAIVEHLALMLEKAPAPVANFVIPPEMAHDIIAKLDEQLQKAMMLALPDKPADGSPSANEPLDDALQVIRSFELAVRVERYDHQQKALLRALFAPFAAVLATAIGFNCDDAMVIEDAYDRRIKAVVAESDRHAREVMADVGRVLKGKPAVDQQTVALVQGFQFAAPGSDVRMQIFWSLLLWGALRTGHALAPNIDELAAETALQRDVLQRVVDTLGVPGAEIQAYWHMVPVGPLKQHPLVKISDRVALPSPGLFLPALQSLFENALKPTTRWEDYQRHRAAYGENRAAELFARALSGATIYKNLKYKSAKGEGEVDVLVIFERNLFLIEVKSGDFAEAARAGIETRVEGTLRDLVIKAHEQVTRAAEYIDGVPVASFRTDQGKVEIKRADFDEVHLLSLTMEQLGHIVNTAKALIYAGQAKAPLTVSLDDLEVLTDVLTLPSLFLHYIARREVYAAFLKVQTGDELGFLESYLSNLLYADPAVYSRFDNVMLDPSSKTVDDFEHARGAGETVSPPTPRVPALVRTLLENLANFRPAGWLAISVVILNLIRRQQRRLARNLDAFLNGKRIREVKVVRAPDGSTTAALRVDDPKVGPDDGSGPTIIVDHQLNVIRIDL